MRQAEAVEAVEDILLVIREMEGTVGVFRVQMGMALDILALD